MARDVADDVFGVLADVVFEHRRQRHSSSHGGTSEETRTGEWRERGDDARFVQEDKPGGYSRSFVHEHFLCCSSWGYGKCYRPSLELRQSG